MRYTTPNSTLPTRYTYTGQYSYIDDSATDLGGAGFGLMFYNARWYDPALGRFAQADTIIPAPYNPQSYDRFAYVLNNPLSYKDPSGHCAVGSDGHIKQTDGKISKTDCTVDDFEKLSWKQRLEWLNLFVQEHNLGNWFDDIKNAIEFMMDDPSLGDADSAANYMDSAVLQAINDGWNVATGGEAIGHNGANGAEGWANFFGQLINCNESGSCGNGNQLLDDRLAAEQDGVDYAGVVTTASQSYKNEDIKSVIELGLFLKVANTYRSFGTKMGEWCAGVCDPRTAGPTLQSVASWAGPLGAEVAYRIPFIRQAWLDAK